MGLKLQILSKKLRALPAGLPAIAHRKGKVKMFELIEDPRKTPNDEAYPDGFDDCPVCGKTADTFYLNKYGDIVGCDCCLKRKSPDTHYNETHCA